MLIIVDNLSFSVWLHRIELRWRDGEIVVTSWCWDHNAARSRAESERMWSPCQDFAVETSRSVQSTMLCVLEGSLVTVMINSQVFHGCPAVAVMRFLRCSSIDGNRISHCGNSALMRTDFAEIRETTGEGANGPWSWYKRYNFLLTVNVRCGIGNDGLGDASGRGRKAAGATGGNSAKERWR